MKPYHNKFSDKYAIKHGDKRLKFTEYSNQELNVMFRNLGKHENLNVKTLLEDHTAEENAKTKKSKKSKHSNKASKIRAKNLETNKKKLINDDKLRLEEYQNLSCLSPEIISDIKFFKTDYGRNRMKFKFLEIARKNKDLNSLIELYLQLISVKPLTKRETKIKEKVAKQMRNFEYKIYQFEKLSNRLPPLDFYNSHKKSLESWQVKVLKFIEKKKDVIVCAKTSMGKTWLAMFPALRGLKTLFIVPTKPLAYQVASCFVKFLNGKTSLITKDVINRVKDEIVVVGTPKEIENELINLNTDFDIIVFDEIHNLNYYDGDSYERLIKIYTPKSNFLALSATIGNSEELRKWFSKISGRRVEKVEYSTRFLNLQRHVWTSNNKLEKVHPFSCLTFDDINSKFLNSNLPLTPYDNIQVYKALCEKFGEIEEVQSLDLDNVFPGDNKRLSLNDSREYELKLKKTLIELKEKESNKIKNLLKSFNREIELFDKVNLHSLFKHIKDSNLIPCIVFQMNTAYCKEIFKKIIYYLEKLETLNYPYYYENLEFCHEGYVKYIEKKKKFTGNLKLGKNEGKGCKNSLKEKLEKKFEEGEVNIFMKELEARYLKQKRTIEKNTDISSRVRNVQLRNLYKNHTYRINSNCIKDYDIWEKHPDFCLNTMAPMTAETIRVIRRSMCKKMEMKIDYNNVFIQGLKRGVGIYTNDMPEIYNQTVQSLAQDGDLGFVISDRTLGLGINMPFRSACILGYKDSIKFPINDYEQMIGRSGRRGLDSEGHIVFCNVDWKFLMKGKLGNITGKKKVLYNYNVLKDISPFELEDTTKVFRNFMNKDIKINTDKIKVIFNEDIIDNRIIWDLRDYHHNVYKWLLIQNVLEMKFKKQAFDMNDIIDLITCLLGSFKEASEDDLPINIKSICLSAVNLQILRQVKLSKITDPVFLTSFIELAEIVKILYNNYLESRYYNNLNRLLKIVFDRLFEIIKKNICFNSNNV